MVFDDVCDVDSVGEVVWLTFSRSIVCMCVRGVQRFLSPGSHEP